MTIPRLTRTAFRKYLEGRPEFEFESSSCGTCPVASFFWHGILPEPHIDLEVHVLSHRVRFGGPIDVRRPLPVWARSFVRKIDSIDNDKHFVTGREALAVLDQV